MRWILILFASFAFASDDFPSLVRTSHVLELENTSFSYTAITGEFPLETTDEEKDPPEIFFIAYFKDGEQNRPITFIFPGGPGGSCGPEVICTYGPRRLLTPDEGKPLLPPYHLIDNPETLLPWTDLVFIDPVGTGFSTLGDDEESLSDLFSVDGDIAALGDFIRTFVAYFNRWNSPKYLSGISYGTTRCCGLAEYLTFHDFSLHGIILLGSAIDLSTLLGQQSRFLPNCLLIPTLAATAWYHERLWPERTLEEVVEYARRFAFDQYAPAMMQPGRISKPEQDAFYKDLSELIGLPLDTVRRYQGRFDECLYTTEFYASERKVLGGLDTRYVGDLTSNRRYFCEDDPSYRDMQGLYCKFNEYLHTELETSRPFEEYIAFSNAINLWNFSTYDSIDWPDLMQRIRRTLVRNPKMKIFVGSGYYDCRTPFGATEYNFEHLDLPPSYQKNLQFEYYEAGHGFVFDHPSLKKLKKDLVGFYEK
jgi:carboxypeptidase C (cathepsin A)